MATVRQVARRPSRDGKQCKNLDDTKREREKEEKVKPPTRSSASKLSHLCIDKCMSLHSAPLAVAAGDAPEVVQGPSLSREPRPIPTRWPGEDVKLVAWSTGGSVEEVIG